MAHSDAQMVAIFLTFCVVLLWQENFFATCQDIITHSSFLRPYHFGLCIDDTSIIMGVPLRSKLECGALCTSHGCSALRWKQEIDGRKVCTIYHSVSDQCLEESQDDYIKHPACLNGGLVNSSECICPPDFTGMNCETNLCPTGVCDSYCQNEGTCICSAGVLTCTCVRGFSGANCEIDVCSTGICDNHCQNEGTCICSAGVLTCICVSGFSGANCENDIGPAATDLILEVSNGLPFGTWGTMDFCDTATFADAFDQLADNTYWGDSTSINVVRLYCTNPLSGGLSLKTPTSSVSPWGTWESVNKCSVDFYIVQFQMMAQPIGVYDDDNTSTNNIRVRCRGPGFSGTEEHVVEGTGYVYGGVWGEWSATCGVGTAVCGIQTRVLPYAYVAGDDTALGDIKLQCCKL